MDKRSSEIMSVAILGALLGLFYGEIMNLVTVDSVAKLGGLFIALIVVIGVLITDLNKKD